MKVLAWLTASHNPDVERLERACLFAVNQLEAERDAGLEQAAEIADHWGEGKDGKALSCKEFEARYGMHNSLADVIRAQKESSTQENHEGPDLVV